MTTCEWINSISGAYYKYLTKVFSYRLKMSELGLTDSLVFHLTDMSVSIGLNISIYTTGWAVENYYGNDIDLFVERSDGKFNWFALQAKVMSFNGAYKDITIKSSPNQWDKLQAHEIKFNSKSFYLLYNGKEIYKNYKSPKRPDCYSIPFIDEYGLGIVETNDLKAVRLNKPIGWIYFIDLFPDHMDCLRKLICCSDIFSAKLVGVDRGDIQTGPPYKQILTDGKIANARNSESEDSQFSEEQQRSLLRQKGLGNTRIIIAK
jgi:hypothetical protein